MLKAKTRKEKKEATRERLIRAAKKVATKKPIETVQIDDITKEASLAHGTFYVHFATKEELFAELVARFNQELATAVSARWDEAFFEKPYPVVLDMASAFLTKLRKDRALVRAFATHFSHGVLAAWLHEGINPPMVGFVLERIKQADMDTGEFDPDTLLHGILGLWARVGFRHALAVRASKKQVTSMLAKMTMGTLRPFFPDIGD